MKKLQRVTILRAAPAGGVAMALSRAAATDARAAVTQGAGQPVRGLDISAYQHTGAPINWHRLPRQGISFVAIKASEGPTTSTPTTRPTHGTRPRPDSPY